jgi:hypothetical protein
VRSETLLRRYPLTGYFVLVFALAWGGVLCVAEGLADSGSSPSTAEVGMVALPMLFAPGLAALALTALVEGKAGLRALWARMTRWRVALRWYALAVAAATPQVPSLRDRHISPHTIRHTTAMHLLQSGEHIDAIALWLGHESPTTTHQYTEANLEMKVKALAKLQDPDTVSRRFRASDSLLEFLKGL